jgi:hypothetical protein
MKAWPCFGRQSREWNWRPPSTIAARSHRHDSLPCRLVIASISRISGAAAPVTVAIYFMHYNFVRIHTTLRFTPAMAARVTTKLWELADMVKVLEDWETTLVNPVLRLLRTDQA